MASAVPITGVCCSASVCLAVSVSQGFLCPSMCTNSSTLATNIFPDFQTLQLLTLITCVLGGVVMVTLLLFLM